MPRWLRPALLATTAVALLGGLAGAVAAASVILGFLARPGSPAEFAIVGEVLEYSAALGFVVGAIAATIGAWIALRHVPLWRISIEVAFSSAFAFVLALAMTSASTAAAVLSALVVGEIAAARLRYAFPVARGAEAPPPA